MEINFPLSKFYLSIGIQDGCEKVVVGGDSGFHYTFMAKKGEGIVEFHKKDHNAELGKEYTVFFQMKISDFENFLKKVSEILPPLIFQYFTTNKMNIGKMARYNWMLQPTPQDGEERAEKVLVITKKGRKFRLKKKIDWSIFVQQFICPHEITEHRSNLFFAYSIKNGSLKKQGFIFRPQFKAGERSFFFVQDRTLLRMSKEMWLQIYHCLSRYDFVNKKGVLEFLSERSSLISS